MAFVNCGHHAPLQVDEDLAAPLDVAEHAPPLGLGVGAVLTPHTAHWQVGSRLLFYTDGAADAWNYSGEPGAERLDHLLRQNAAKPVRSVIRTLARAIQSVAGHDAIDDVCLLAIKRNRG